MKTVLILLEEISRIKQREKDLRNFGIIFFAAGLIAAFIVFLKHGFDSRALYIFAGAGLVFLFLGIFTPSILKIPHKIWMSIAVVLGFFLTKLILIATYILLITPMGLLLRLLGKDLLDLKITGEDKSFWKDYETVDSNERYTKMF